MRLTNNNKGLISILGVIIAITFLFFVMGLANITKINYIRSETQGIMDNSGVIALREAINMDEWRREKIVVNESFAKKRFIQHVDKQMSTLKNNNAIDGYKIEELKVYNPNNNGGNNRGKGSYYIESVITVDYKPVTYVSDLSSRSMVGFINFFNKDRYESRVASGEKLDGKGELILRSVSSIAYR